MRDLSAVDLAAEAIRSLVDRNGLPGELVDDVILGQCYPNGEAPALGRVAALEAGLPVTVTGQQLDRRCGSGLMAVIEASMRVATGAADLVIAGGAESMSQVEHYTVARRWGNSPIGNDELVDRLARARVTAGGQRYPVPGGMVETAENLRRSRNISRQAQDEFALRSHSSAVAAQERGAFDEEIVPVPLADGRTLVSDEGPRSDTSLERLAALKPLMAAVDSEATVTPGNSCPQNDGAAVCIVAHAPLARELGLAPMARLVGWQAAGVTPAEMGIGPVPAVNRLLQRTGYTWRDIDLIELNEAFAAQVLACTHDWGFTKRDFDRLNVSGSAISLGHPVGATGGRILATLLHELHRRGGHLGLETMCIGGGQGLAALFETIQPN